MNDLIPYGRPDLDQQDVDEVLAVLKSDFLTQGPKVPEFEQALAAYCGATHAVAVSSATSALHVACLALGVGPGDRVWTTPITFVASANCALYCGAMVDFVDIDARTYNLSLERLAEKLELAERTGTLPKVLIAVHLCGQSCDMAAIGELSCRYGFKVIEDASHAVGGRYRGEAVGSCRYSDITVFSFHPVKIITTAEGGVAVTNDEVLAGRMALLRSHGVTRDPRLMTHESHGPWYYQQVDLGFNYRMTELQGALGLSQLRRLDAFVARRHQLAEVYDLHFTALPITTPWQHPECYAGRHLYVVRVDGMKTSKTRAEVYDHLRRAGIGVNVHYIPVYSQPYFQRFGYSAAQFPESERYYAEAISLPMYSALTDEDQRRVIVAVAEAFSK
jgi:UDP-4-amino-4,6-dideoxy-N-acetyl-beta-L-altrosamine transaminase